MYIRIENEDHSETHECKSYYKNTLKNGTDFNAVRVDGEFLQFHISNDDPKIAYVMNDNGKTIDRI